MPKNDFKRPGRPGWYVRVKVNGRVIVRGSYSTISLAQVALADMRREIERGRLGLPKRTRTTFREFVDNVFCPWADNHLRPATRKNYRTALRHALLTAFGSLTLRDITRERVETSLESRGREVQGASANRDLALLSRILTMACEKGEIEVNP